MPMALSISLGILLAALLGWIFYSLTWFILLLYLSFIIATILDAPVQWLKRHGLRRGLSTVIIMFGTAALLIGGLYGMGAFIYGQFEALSTSLHKTPQRVNDFVNGLRARFADASGDFDVTESLASAVPEVGTLLSNAMYGVELLTYTVVVFFVVMYMVIDGPDHLKAARSMLPKESRLEATRVFNAMARAHRGWFLASTGNVVSSAIMTGLGLYFLGVPGSIVLGLVAGLGEMVPNVGPIIAALPAVLITAIAEPEKTLYVITMFLIVQTIQSYTISPLVMKVGVELPVLVTIVSVLAMGTLFGFLGILVAIPLVADAVVLWNYFAYLREKDTADYDDVNDAPAPVREAPTTENRRSRLRGIFRRQNPPEKPAETPGEKPAGMDRLEQVENRAKRL